MSNFFGLLRFHPCTRAWWDLPPMAVKGPYKQCSSSLHCSFWPLPATFFGNVSMVLSLPTIVRASFWKLLFQRGFFWQYGDLYANKCTACSFEPQKGLLRHSLFSLKKTKCVTMISMKKVLQSQHNTEFRKKKNMWFELTLYKRLAAQLASELIPNPCFSLPRWGGRVEFC